ncbi:hypothetical protein FEM48_Zijuj02G0056000 [Ziziphus jujuba var. spinosa]|uniref:Uncharacterized protein n=1 Tax=Ziziphus jujuba var. spinosa TaxID=714518 RepID=A0A978VTX9_ZIZJJ|nr:hypothetical protein FEM48_Zijuj02G0056000 [Ziziphus jujuba var. spinosa]
MASLTMVFGPAATGSFFAATAAKGAGGSKEEKGLLDWILGGLQKEDQLLETDPILKKLCIPNYAAAAAIWGFCCWPC